MSFFLPVLSKSSPLRFLTEYFALKNVLDAPAIGSVRIPAIVFCVYQLMFAAITYVPHFVPSYQTKPPNHEFISLVSSSQSVPLLNVANLVQSSSSCSYGKPSSTTPSPAGLGTPTAGRSNSVVSTLLVVLPSTFPPAQLLWPSQSILASVAAMALNASPTSLITPVTSFSVLSCSGSVGSASMVARL